MSLQVEGTNDSSCLSKYSAAEKGFFSDEFLQYFVSKCPRRAPLIHLGYCVRAKIINSLIEEFVQIGSSFKQIISLGAGFDTLYFKLKSKHENRKLKYYEFDLPRVVERKVDCIKRSERLMDLIKGFSVNEDGLVSEDYKLLAVDLREVKTLSKLLKKYGLDPDSPTLFLSECAITYLEDDKSTDLIKFASSLQNATFVTYEQLLPHDGFGQVMVQHFASLCSPLMSVERYPTVELQIKRYTRNNWDYCSCLSALDSYKMLIPEEEQSRVLGLEPFDEWEELYLKCLHYAVVIASKGSLSNWSKLCRTTVLDEDIFETKTLTLDFMKAGEVCRYGHCVIVSNNQYVLIGGFGIRKNGNHGRMKDVVWLRQDGLCFTVSNAVEMTEFATMYSSWTCLSNGSFIVYGGRTSPTNSVFQCPQIVTFSSNGSVVISPLVESCDRPGRWRHSAVVVERDGVETFLVFGGRTSELQILSDAWIIPLIPNFKDREIFEVVDPVSQPCARFSHSATVTKSKLRGCEMWVVGGMADSGPLADVWCLDITTLRWRQLSVIGGSIARFGHSASAHGGSLVLVGGVTDRCSGQGPVSVLDLASGVIVHYQLPVMSPGTSLLPINHCHIASEDEREIWIIGGGGNCFSFGTYFNTDIAVIKLKDLNL